MKAAIELHQLAKVRPALPPAPMRAALPRATPQTGRQHPPPQRVVMHVQVVLTRQVLRRQRRPEPLADRAAVFLADQREDAVALGRGTRRIRATARAITPARVSSRVLIAVRPNLRPPGRQLRGTFLFR